MKAGKVILVGAGPGDVGLITVRGLEALRGADVVVYDRLVNPSLLAECHPQAIRLYAGKGPGGLKQPEINAALVEHARAGRTVCRLKGGDPFLFGRGGEEASYLAEHAIPFEIVPGVTSAIAVPAYAGIPVTDRRFASTVAMATGHPAESEDGDAASEAQGPRWRQLNGADTLVVLMGVGALEELTNELLAAGRSPDEPAAVIERGTTPRQRVVLGCLGDIAARARAAGVAPPAILVLGGVVRLRETLAWAENKPLWGLRVLVTRPAGQAEALSALLRARGAEAVEFPCLEVRAVESYVPALDGACDWILFVSVNGAAAASAALHAAGRDSRAFPPGRIGAVGPATAQAVERIGLRVDFVPSRYTVAALARELPGPLEGRTVLLPGRAQINPRLCDALTGRGARLVVWPVYEVATARPAVGLADLVGDGVDIVTLTSPSAAAALVELGGKQVLGEAVVACIGPPTAAAARQVGLAPAVVASEHTAEGLVDAIIEQRKASR